MAQAATATLGGSPRRGSTRWVDEYRVELAMLGVLILLGAALSVAADNFLTERNLRNVMWQSTAIGIVAIG
ncbi:MAG: hypothetical protein M3Y37_09695, partial [Chloroflexota bacterium]|nr:hypothetical protein [Chloroflexota bacterium]